MGTTAAVGTSISTNFNDDDPAPGSAKSPAPSTLRRGVLAGLLGLAGAAVATSQANAEPQSQLVSNDADWHLARRCAQGVSPDLVAEIKQQGRRAWLEAQFKPETIGDGFTESLLQKNFKVLREKPLALTKLAQDLRNGLASVLMCDLIIRQATTKRVLQEAMVEFWADLMHVPIYTDVAIFNLPERVQMLRDNALTSFKELLWKSTTDVAMLRSLGNVVSSKEAPNENLGRELLELHSLGVGNFTEADVKAATILLTGLSLNWDTHEFSYEEYLHATGAVKFTTGFKAANSTADEASVLKTVRDFTDHLATHPATAERVVSRLVTRFVTQDAAAGLVARLTKVYLASDTAIVPVLRELFNSPEFAASVGQLVRRPRESVATIMRIAKITDVSVESQTVGWKMLVNWRDMMEDTGHGPMNWAAPNGFPDNNRYWLSSSVMLQVWNLIMTIAMQAEWPTGITFDWNWAKRFGVKEGDQVGPLVDRISEQELGIKLPAAARRDIVSAALADSENQADGERAVIDQNFIEYGLPALVGMIFCSPYFLAR